MTSVPNPLQQLSGSKSGIFWLCLAVLFTFSACNKKIFSRKGKKNDGEETVKTEPEVEEDKGPFKREAPVLSLLLPFHLDEIEPRFANELASFRRSALALDFYQGFKMGLDSLSAAGANFKLQVYDTKDEPTEISRLLMKPELGESQLIVGPIFPGGMNIMGRYAQNHQIHFISPLLPRVVVENNPFQVVASAPLEMHTRKAAQFISETLRPSAVTIVSSADSDEGKYISSFMKEMSGQSVHVNEVDVGRYGVSISRLKAHLHEGLNVLVVPSQDATFWNILFSYLGMRSGSARFVIVAHPGFSDMKGLNMATAEKFQVHFTASAGQAATTGFYNAYRQKYSTPPSEYAAKGFDLAMYFGAALWNEEEDFEEAISTPYVGYQNEFNFERTPNGYVNQGVALFRVRESGFVEVE